MHCHCRLIWNDVHLNKLAIGKPATSADETNGYMPPAMLASCIEKAHAKGWRGGDMVWQVRRLPLSRWWCYDHLLSPLAVRRGLDQVDEGLHPLHAPSLLARLFSALAPIQVAKIHDPS